VNSDWSLRALSVDEIDAVTQVLGLARLHQGDGFYLVAWHHDEPIGHAHLALTDPPEVQDVEVREDWRGRGVGTALLHAAEDAARQRGGATLRMSVSTSNDSARRLYRSLGYLDAGEPVRHVVGAIEIRTGPIEVDDWLLTLEKRL
jgi:ribosomal protein S18 acetylase RimI-like enzyme